MILFLFITSLSLQVQRIKLTPCFDVLIYDVKRRSVHTTSCINKNICIWITHLYILNIWLETFLADSINFKVLLFVVYLNENNMCVLSKLLINCLFFGSTRWYENSSTCKIQWHFCNNHFKKLKTLVYFFLLLSYCVLFCLCFPCICILISFIN